MSCNGCRVLRKGCGDDCVLRPCLHWIKSPDAQGNATVFLAKFYGRAGLINLLNAGPDHLRHEIFRSLLYEACGRIINPIYGAAGLMWSGNWERCQAAVEAVLDGGPIMKVSTTADDEAEGHPIMPLKGCDIRHLGKNDNNNNNNNNNRVKVTRNRFKRSGSRSNQLVNVNANWNENEQVKFSITGWDHGQTDMINVSSYDDGEDMNRLMMTMKREPSHDSASVETVELSLVNREEPGLVFNHMNAGADVEEAEDGDLTLDLSLGFYPVRRS